MKKFGYVLALVIAAGILSVPVFAEESGAAESGQAEPEYLERAIGFIGFIAAIIASYTSIKAFGGMVGRAMKLYSAGILLIGIASITCFIFYIVGMGREQDLAVQIEDGLRTVSLILFSVAGYKLYCGSRAADKE